MLQRRNDFDKDMQNFRSHEEPEGRFAKAKAIYWNQLNHEKQQKYNWQRAFFGALLIGIFLTGGLVYVSTNSFIKTYIIEVDSSTGMVRNVGAAQDSQYTIKEEVVKYFIGQYVDKVRSVPLDKLLYDKNWSEARTMMTSSAAAKMAQVMNNDNDMNNVFGKKTILPKSIVMVPVTKDTYQYRWTEEHFMLNGTGQKENRIMTGVFTIEYGKPNEQEIFVNPLGIRIKDFSWAPEKK